MKKLLRPLLLILVIVSCKGEDDESKAFVKAFFKPSDSLVYVGDVPKYEIAVIKKVLAADTLRSFLFLNEYGFIDDKLILDKTERSDLNNQLNKLDDKEWYEGLLDNSTVLQEDTVDSIFKQNNILGWQYFYKHYGLKLHRFSKPILLRNNTICIFYFDYTCGYVCGDGQLVVFRKERNIWKKWLLLSHWIS